MSVLREQYKEEVAVFEEHGLASRQIGQEVMVISI
jgi:hypothetical protein